MSTIRSARLADLPALESIEADSFNHDRLSRRSMRKALRSDRQLLLVAADEADIAQGYALLHFRSDAGHARLYSLAVARQRRGGGIGRELLAAADAEAARRGYKRLRLEVRRDDAATVNFYLRNGYAANRVLASYYADGADAMRMEKAVVNGSGLASIRSQNSIAVIVGRIQDKKPLTEAAETLNLRLLTASEYLAQPSASEGVRQIVNLCPVDEYLSQGYYISLLARARAQRSMPNIDTVTGLIWKKLYRDYLGELTELVRKRIPAPIRDGENSELAIQVYFGQTELEWARRMAARAYRLFPAPILEIMLRRRARGWKTEYIWPLSSASLAKPEFPRFIRALGEYCQNRRNPVSRRKHAQFDLAILVNPKEQFPPSDEAALRLISRAAERQNLRTEMVGPKDLDKVTRFDALFIRETTNIDNHTFTFARIAEANGLPVIDDSVSILRCSNKVFLREAMVRARIATPATELLTKGNFQEVALRIEYPCVLKIPDGSFSRGVFKISDAHEFAAKASELLEDSAIILAQEFLPTEFDWRIGVLDGKPLFACKYHMAKGHWQVYNHALKRKVNYGQSETILVEEAPASIVKAAVRASLQMGRGLYGVDLKEVGATAYVIEVNDNPNLDAGTEDGRTGEALYDAIISVFRQRILTAKGLAQPPQPNRAA